MWISIKSATTRAKVSNEFAWIAFAYRNCFLAPAKRYSGILRTVESHRRQLQDLLPLCRLRTQPLLFRRSVCLFILLPVFFSLSYAISVRMSSLSFPRRINLCRSLFFRDSAFEILLPWLKESVDSPGFPGKLTRASRKSFGSSLRFFFFFSASLSTKFFSSRLTLKHIEFSIKM